MQFIVYNVLVCCHILDAGIQVVQVWIQIFFRGICLVCVRARGWGSPDHSPRLHHPIKARVFGLFWLWQKSNTSKIETIRYCFSVCPQRLSSKASKILFWCQTVQVHRNIGQASFTSCSNSCSNYIFWHVVITILFSILPKAVTDKTFAARFTWWTIS